MKNILITGCAGFIGFSLSKYLLDKKINIIGIDNVNNYYNTSLKKERLGQLQKYKSFKFIKGDISSKTTFNRIKSNNIDLVVNLAAQVGVRYSLKNPNSYVKSNIIGFLNLINFCNKKKILKIYYASSSSVYGDNKKVPFNEKDNVNKPIQFYAVTKITNELMAYAYSNIYNLEFTGFRFFTVYGPYGRPDMAVYKFSEKIMTNKSIDVFGNGNHVRDITYIDDIVKSIYKVIKKDSSNKNQSKSKIFNIGSGTKIKVIKIIKTLEKLFNKRANIVFKEKISADMEITESSNDNIDQYIGKFKKTSYKTGLKKFVEWYKENEKK